MQTIGITGQSGFIGSFLTNYLKFIEGKSFKLIDFEDSYFEDSAKLEKFISGCDVVIHLAGMSRGEDGEVYQTNLKITDKLISALKNTRSKAQIIFASSIHEKTNSGFGKSKKVLRQRLAHFAKQNGNNFVGLVIPHVFGPFAKPFHNSAFTTFCYQLTHNQKPKLTGDGELNLIFVESLSREIVGMIKEKLNCPRYLVKPQRKIKVSKVLQMLSGFSDMYLKKGIFPQLDDDFELNAFNTLRSYIDDDKRKISLIKHEDPRGYFCEAVKVKGIGGQLSYSLSNKSIIRGDHFHTKKIERFCVISGEAKINLRRIGAAEATTFKVSADQPEFIDMPIWYAHNIENISKKPLITLFYSNEIFDPKNPDTYHEKV